MRILVTGSREFTKRKIVEKVLSEFAPANSITVVVGYDPKTQTPRGVDEFAYEWAIDEKRWWATPECHPADWERDCDENCFHAPRFGYCPRAGHLRNQEMVDSGADICLAFFKAGAKNHGTRDCSRRAKAAGIKVLKYREY